MPLFLLTDRPHLHPAAENFCVDLFFVGTDGYSRKTGFTNHDQMRAQAVRDMSLQADRLVVLRKARNSKNAVRFP